VAEVADDDQEGEICGIIDVLRVQDKVEKASETSMLQDTLSTRRLRDLSVAEES
jgi:hypothetical protein